MTAPDRRAEGDSPDSGGDVAVRRQGGAARGERDTSASPGFSGKHVGAILTTGLAGVALALAMLQAAVIVHHARTNVTPPSARPQSNRYSAPGGRSGIPWLPFDEKAQRNKSPEGRTPAKPEERQSPPSQKQKSAPGFGPRPARRAVA